MSKPKEVAKDFPKVWMVCAGTAYNDTKRGNRHDFNVAPRRQILLCARLFTP